MIVKNVFKTLSRKSWCFSHEPASLPLFWNHSKVWAMFTTLDNFLKNVLVDLGGGSGGPDPHMVHDYIFQYKITWYTFLGHYYEKMPLWAKSRFTPEHVRNSMIVCCVCKNVFGSGEWLWSSICKSFLQSSIDSFWNYTLACNSVRTKKNIFCKVSYEAGNSGTTP